MSEQRKNILFITADQWRSDCLSGLQHPHVSTPNLDWLARQGTLFTHHFANAAPCGPSRACLHTGRYLMNHRSATNGTPLDQRFRNWAQILRKSGRDPLLFGYTDTSADPRSWPDDAPQLRTYEGPLPGIKPVVHLTADVTPWADWLQAQGVAVPEQPYDLYRQRKAGTEYEHGGDAPLPLRLPAHLHDTAFMVDSVRQTIAAASRQTSAPWTIHLSLLRPHPPWIAPSPYNHICDPSTLTEWNRTPDRATEAQQHPWLAWQMQRPHFHLPEDLRMQQRLRASYYGLMREVDDNLGRLFRDLQRSGQLERTLIIFTSDHGEQMGDHWMLGKSGYFDESFRIPLIIFNPDACADATRGSKVSAFTENVDIVPTLLDALGLPPEPGDGASLVPLLQGEQPADWRESVFWEYDFRNVVDMAAEQEFSCCMDECNLAVMRSKHAKYVHFAALPPLYFDLANDPSERMNLSGQSQTNRDELSAARNMLSFRMKHMDQTLTHSALTDTGVAQR